LKHVVSVSLGSPLRDYETEIINPFCTLLVRRIGTGGDLGRAAGLLKGLDGAVSALGMGGVNLTLQAGERQYKLPAGSKLAAQVNKTPLVDGWGIKDTIERDLVSYIREKAGWPRRDQVVLIASVLDRFGLAASLEQAGCRLIIGDAMFALGLPLPFYHLDSFNTAARVALPLLRKLPIGFLYPLGDKQETSKPRYERFYRLAEIIAGDFHFLRRHLPADLSGKDIITSTVSVEDVQDLKNRGARWLATTGPSFNGRSLGANVLEAVCAALLESKRGPAPAHYPGLFRQLGWKPRLERLN
jgi:hypothetical protein